MKYRQKLNFLMTKELSWLMMALLVCRISLAGVTEGYSLVLPEKEQHVYLFGDHHEAGRAVKGGQRRPVLGQLDEFVELLEQKAPELLVLLEKPGLCYDQDSVLGLLDIRAQKLPTVSVKNAEVRRKAIAAEVILEAGKKYLGDDWVCFIGDKPYGELTLRHVIEELEAHYEAFVSFSSRSPSNGYLKQTLEDLREKIDGLYEELLTLLNLDIRDIAKLKEISESHYKMLEMLYRNTHERSSYLEKKLPFLRAHVLECHIYLTSHHELILKHSVRKTLLEALELQCIFVIQELENFSCGAEEEFLESLNCLRPALQNIIELSGELFKAFLGCLDVPIRSLDEEKLAKDVSRQLMSVLMSPADSCLDVSLYQAVLESKTDVCVVAGAEHIRRVKALLERIGAETVTRKVPYSSYPKEALDIELLNKKEIGHIFKTLPSQKAANEIIVRGEEEMNYDRKAQGRGHQKILLLTVSLVVGMIIGAKEGKNNAKETAYETITESFTTEPFRRR